MENDAINGRETSGNSRHGPEFSGNWNLAVYSCPRFGVTYEILDKRKAARLANEIK
jgi:hypothetical protein